MSGLLLSDIDFKTKMAWVWTTHNETVQGPCSVFLVLFCNGNVGRWICSRIGQFSDIKNFEREKRTISASYWFYCISKSNCKISNKFKFLYGSGNATYPSWKYPTFNPTQLKWCASSRWSSSLYCPGGSKWTLKTRTGYIDVGDKWTLATLSWWQFF